MNDFIKLAIRTESTKMPIICNRDAFDDITDNRLLHAAMGLSTEANEFLDPLKKHLFYGKPLDLINLKEELGDMLWYMAIAMDALDTTFEVEMERVINKLRIRYPDKFTEHDAINRDLTAERRKLEE
jgi:NTP pyrophosphatase (non-canonical NTP hydrolase)